MRKGYAVYFVASLVLLIGAGFLLLRLDAKSDRATGMLQQQLAALDREAAVTEARQDESQRYRQQRALEKVQALSEQMRETDRIVREAAEAINTEIAMASPPEPPTPVTGYAPARPTTGPSYSNVDLRPDTHPGHVIIDFLPEHANGINWKSAVASGRCAAFSFVDANGVKKNRLFCDPVVAR